MYDINNIFNIYFIRRCVPICNDSTNVSQVFKFKLDSRC